VVVEIGIEIKKWISIDIFSPDTVGLKMFIIPKRFLIDSSTNTIGGISL
jgi:hypothetical protein